LKRFDFNLRSLQRSKINDYFSFPTKIDMAPYTIDHLTNPETDKEDMFELVGVLVHAGTAESGHYYSYIRERPTSGTTESWVEFNDETVTPWDPAQLETSTFGGPDYRPTFDSSVPLYDKTYSAYMLFYQRSSSFKEEQEKLVQAGCPTPFQVEVPRDISDHIKHENTVMLRRHCLYDPTHIAFVKEVFRHAVRLEVAGCSDDHKLESLAMDMALGHLDQVVSRTKDLPDFNSFALVMLSSACTACEKCSFAFYDYFNERTESFRQLVQRNPDAVVRKEVGTMFVNALEIIKDKLPQLYGFSSGTPDSELGDWGPSDRPVLRGVVRIFNLIWANFHMNLRSWHECFYVMAAFAQMGDVETAICLSEDYLFNALRIVWADPGMDLPQNYARMVNAVVRRMATRPPAYDSIIMLIDQLLTGLHPYFDSNYIIDSPEPRLQMWLRHHAPLPWTSSEVQVIHQDWNRSAASIFVDKLISIDQGRDATETILERLIQSGKMMDNKVWYTLRANITGQMMQHVVTPYLRAAAVYCQTSDQADLVQKMMTHISAQCRNIQNSEGKAFMAFFREMIQGVVPNCGQHTLGVYLSGVSGIPKWAPGLLGYYDPSVRLDAEEFLRRLIFSFGTSPEFPSNLGGEERASVMRSAARQLGINCLVFLRENYVQRRVQVARESVASLLRTVAQCAKYFVADGEEEQGQEDAEFAELSRGRYHLEGDVPRTNDGKC
jgi:ubiquitin carboxyl-terminal hydrolase 34